MLMRTNVGQDYKSRMIQDHKPMEVQFCTDNSENLQNKALFVKRKASTRDDDRPPQDTFLFNFQDPSDLECALGKVDLNK